MPLLRRSLFSGLMAFVFLFTSLAAGTAQAASVAYADEEPSELAMLGDALVARPLLAGATFLGWAAFTVTLPVSALGGNVDQAAEKLVRAPARSTFLRCLGCTPIQHEHRQSEKRTAKLNAKQNN